jgi:hypothetical protein
MQRLLSSHQRLVEAAVCVSSLKLVRDDLSAAFNFRLASSLWRAANVLPVSSSFSILCVPLQLS